MKAPLTTESVLFISGWYWRLRDRTGRIVADNIRDETEAKLIALLVNKDFEEFKREQRRCLPQMSEMNEVDSQRTDEE